MVKILNADYGGKDVTEIIVNNFFREDTIRVMVNNETMGGDPRPHVTKKLLLEVEKDGEIVHLEANEGENFVYPKTPYTEFNTLLLTSCNRVEQVLLAIAVNKEIIQTPFNLIVSDCSTDYLSTEQGVNMHRSDDPYNMIDENNYNSDWRLFEPYIRTIPKIKNFQVIHFSPRQNKQQGEANLISYGLAASSNMGSKHLLKLTGVCHLKYDVFAEFPEIIGNRSVVTWKRSGHHDQKSTRIFGCNPSKFGPILNAAGWTRWVDEYDFIERKLGRIIDEGIEPDMINHLERDERGILVDEGIKQKDYRGIILQNLKKHGLENSNDPWIRKFYDNKIW